MKSEWPQFPPEETKHLSEIRIKLYRWWDTYRKNIALAELADDKHLTKLDDAIIQLIRPHAKDVPNILNKLSSWMIEKSDPNVNRDWFSEENYAEMLPVYRIKESSFLLDLHRIHQEKIPVFTVNARREDGTVQTWPRTYPMYSYEVECGITSFAQAKKHYDAECRNRFLIR